MKKSLILIIILASTISYGQIEDYTVFLSKQKVSAKNYILQLFESNDIVIICERAHPETTQYDLFFEIISDEKFIDDVGTGCTEIGRENLNNQVENFINTDFLTMDEKYREVLDISRNLSFYELHTKYNYTQFLLQLNDLNTIQNNEKKY